MTVTHSTTCDGVVQVVVAAQLRAVRVPAADWHAQLVVGVAVKPGTLDASFCAASVIPAVFAALARFWEPNNAPASAALETSIALKATVPNSNAPISNRTRNGITSAISTIACPASVRSVERRK